MTLKHSAILGLEPVFFQGKTLKTLLGFMLSMASWEQE